MIDLELHAMPDWSYHPAFKHLFFRLGPEDARRFTIALMEIQSRTALGRWIFQLLAYGLPPKPTATSVLGLPLRSPVGMGAGIDVDAAALAVLQYLGFGYMVVGPVGHRAVPRRYSTEPLRIMERQGVVSSPFAPGTDAVTVARRLARVAPLELPVGAVLRHEGDADDLFRAMETLRPHVAFFSIPAVCTRGATHLSELAAASGRPLLFRAPLEVAETDPGAIAAAAEAGWQGCVVAGSRSPLLPAGELDSPTLSQRACAALRSLRETLGHGFALVGGTGISTPAEGTDALAAGANMLDLYAGLVFAGPGLAARINKALIRSQLRSMHGDVVGVQAAR